MDFLERDDPAYIGPYRLLARLGEGGMGRVFLARSPTDALVAVKVIKENLAHDKAFRRRFTHEVAAAQRVHGRYTAQVLAADVDADVPWLATEYVRGYSLAELVAERNPLSEDRVRLLGCGIASALQSVHAADVVHRDVKPLNVLMATDGPRLVDFGIARAAEASSVTQVGQFVGSAGYIAPEQVEGRRIDGKADVFSLGAVLVFALTGTGPFGEGSGTSLAYRVVHNEPEIPPIADPALADLVRRCLAKDPADRPSPDEIAAALGPTPTDGFVPADWLPEEAPLAPRRKPGPGVPTEPANPHNDSDSWPDLPPVAPPRRSRRGLVAASVAVALLVAAGTAYAFGPFPHRASPEKTPDTGADGATASPSNVVANLPTAPPPTHPPVDNPPPGVTPPTMPANLTASPVSTTAIDLRWTDTSSNETGFEIVTPGGSVNVGANTTSYTWGGLSAGSSLCFAIEAYNSAGYSATYPNASPWWVCAVTLAPPAPPSSLTALATNASTIHLTWQDNSANETGFTIANNSGSTQTTAAGTTTYDWTGLSAGTTMCFQIRADNAVGSSSYQPASPTVCATTPGPPAAPSGLTATALDSTSILLQWADNSANETGFTIANDTSSTRTAAANATQYTWTGLANGATMCFQVRADNAVGSSSYQPASPTVCATTPVVAMPSNVTVTQINSNTVRIQWTDNSNNETGFGIYSGVNTGVGGAAYGSRSVGANTTSYDWTGLAGGMWRCFQLSATSGSGNSGLTNWACVGGVTATAPAVPTNITVTAIDSSTLRVQWSDTSTNEAAWEIDLSTGGFVIALANASFYDYTGLSPGTQRCFGVGAFNPLGVTFPSDEQGQLPSERATHCGTTLP